jgi:hypothetical protein
MGVCWAAEGFEVVSSDSGDDMEQAEFVKERRMTLVIYTPRVWPQELSR